MILNESMQIAVLWLLGANLIAFIAFGWDKRAARLNNRRIPEAKLLMFVVLGGGAGALFGQRIFRHKTQKRPFKTQMWVIIVLQIVGVIGYLLFLN